MADINDIKDICISSGTLRAEDLLPKFMGILKDYAPEKFNEFIKGYPELDGWEEFLREDWRLVSDDTKVDACDALFGLLNDIAPEGTMFSSTEGDGSDFGFWSVEEKKEESKDITTLTDLKKFILSKNDNFVVFGVNSTGDLYFVDSVNGKEVPASADSLAVAEDDSDEHGKHIGNQGTGYFVVWKNGKRPTYMTAQQIYDELLKIARSWTVAEKLLDDDEGEKALKKLQGRLSQYKGKTTGQIAADVRYDVATALDVAVDKAEDLMTKFGLDKIYVLRAQGLSPQAIAKKILKACESKDEGWLGGFYSRQDVLDAMDGGILNKDWKLEKRFGNWGCYVNQDTGRPLVLQVMVSQDRNGDWGYKPVTSDMGPVDTNIQAAKWLKPRLEEWVEKNPDLAKDVPDYEWGWIEKCLGKETANKDRKNLVSSLVKGDKIKLIDTVADGAVVTFIDMITPTKMRILHNGREMSCKTSFIDRKVEESKSEAALRPWRTDFEKDLQKRIDDAKGTKYDTQDFIADGWEFVTGDVHDDGSDAGKDVAVAFFKREQDGQDYRMWLAFDPDTKEITGGKWWIESNESQYERRDNADYLQEVWDALVHVWDKDKFDMAKGYDDEYECEAITITVKDNEGVRAKIYVDDHEGKHPVGFDVIYRYPGDKGVGDLGYYEFQSTDFDEVAPEIFAYFDELKGKVGEAKDKFVVGMMISLDGVKQYIREIKPRTFVGQSVDTGKEFTLPLASLNRASVLFDPRTSEKQSEAKGDNWVAYYFCEDPQGMEWAVLPHAINGIGNARCVNARGGHDSISIKYVLDKCTPIKDVKGSDIYSKVKDFEDRDIVALSRDEAERVSNAADRLEMLKSVVAGKDESCKSEATGVAAIYGDGDVSTYENSADGFYVDEHDPMGFAVLNNDTATMKKLFSGKAVAPDKPWTYAGWHEDTDAPENKDGSYPYVYDWEREYDLNFVNDGMRVVGDKNNEQALELLLKYAPDFIPSAMDFWNAFHAGYSKGLLRKLFDNIFAVVDKDDPDNNYLGYGDYTYDEVAKFLGSKDEAADSRRVDDYANMRFFDPEEFVKYVRKAYGKDGGYVSIDSVVPVSVLDKANRMAQKNGYNKLESKNESLTLKQKELKDMARYGEAEDITTISDAEAKELKKKGIETVGVSRGTYGMNGALLRDRDGNKYVITARSSNLFYFV